MEIERTSQVIKLMMEDCYDEDECSTDINNLENWEEKMQFMFTSFAHNKNLTVDYSSVKNLLEKFNTLYKNGYFASFTPPYIQEYFCKQLNYLLIIDFILTFFRIDDKNFNVKQINTKLISDFFVRLGDFYNFMNYLDVDEDFVNYLKYMIVLHSFQLDRNIIEENYHYFVSILDDFFQNNIMFQVFKNINYKGFNSMLEQINEYDKRFSEEIRDYDNSQDYCDKVYEYLDDMFIMNKDWSNLPLDVAVKKKTIDLLNPEHPDHPQHNPDNVFSDGRGLDYDTGDEFDNYEEYLEHRRRQTWKVPMIKKDDVNYKEYRKLFILRTYQKLKNEYNNIISEIKTMCAHIYLNKYNDFEPNNNHSEIKKVKTILGCIFDYNTICVGNDIEYATIFGLACEYGHIEIVKVLLEKKNGNIGRSNFEKAHTSPNRDIPRYLIENRNRLYGLNQLFIEYKDVNFFEPKIKFN